MHHAKRESTTMGDNAAIGGIIHSTHQLLKERLGKRENPNHYLSTARVFSSNDLYRYA
jgi:hypothetical protein